MIWKVGGEICRLPASIETPGSVFKFSSNQPGVGRLVLLLFVLRLHFNLLAVWVKKVVTPAKYVSNEKPIILSNYCDSSL